MTTTSQPGSGACASSRTGAGPRSCSPRPGRGLADCWATGVTTIADTGDRGVVIRALAECGGVGHRVPGGVRAASRSGASRAWTDFGCDGGRPSSAASESLRVRLGVSPHAPYTVSGPAYPRRKRARPGREGRGLPLAVHPGRIASRVRSFWRAAPMAPSPRLGAGGGFRCPRRYRAGRPVALAGRAWSAVGADALHPRSPGRSGGRRSAWPAGAAVAHCPLRTGARPRRRAARGAPRRRCPGRARHRLGGERGDARSAGGGPRGPGPGGSTPAQPSRSHPRRRARPRPRARRSGAWRRASGATVSSSARRHRIRNGRSEERVLAAARGTWWRPMWEDGTCIETADRYEDPAPCRDPAGRPGAAHREPGRPAGLVTEGYDVTQATLSRDIRELGLAKLADPQGGAFYAHPHRRRFGPTSRRCCRPAGERGRRGAPSGAQDRERVGRGDYRGAGPGGVGRSHRHRRRGRHRPGDHAQPAAPGVRRPAYPGPGQEVACGQDLPCWPVNPVGYA